MRFLFSSLLFVCCFFASTKATAQIGPPVNVEPAPFVYLCDGGYVCIAKRVYFDVCLHDLSPRAQYIRIQNVSAAGTVLEPVNGSSSVNVSILMPIMGVHQVEVLDANMQVIATTTFKLIKC